MQRKLLLMALEDWRYTDEQLSQVRQIAPALDVLVSTDRDVIADKLDDVEVMVGGIPTDLVPRAPRLRWVQLWGAGAEWLLDHPELADSTLVVTNASGIHAIPISEHILALLLAFVRRLPAAFRHQQEHRWASPGWFDVDELAGKTLLLIGVGAIGGRTAHVADALGMTVIGLRRNPTLSVDGVRRMVGPDDLVAVLPEADFVVITAPLTPETQAMIGDRELSAMKSTAVIVNIGRGSTIDQAALVRALEDGRIAGAGLDVFEPEPLPADSPLWAMENVIITCHYAGKSPRYDERAWAIFLDNLARYVAGQPLVNVVDKRLGY